MVSSSSLFGMGLVASPPSCFTFLMWTSNSVYGVEVTHVLYSCTKICLPSN